jgi:acetyltransferase-like isoleucine patch superfamily enzyme
VKLGDALKRFLLPGSVVSLVCLVRYGARVSPRAEVDLSPLLRLGRGVQVSSFCKLKAIQGPLEIGEYTDVGPGCFVTAMKGGLSIGKNVLVGPNCAILSGTYIYDDLSRPLREQGHRSKGTRIGDNVLIGAGSVVLDGSNIGDGAIVSPNSVVSGTIEPNVLVQGNPARTIFRREWLQQS